MPEEAIKYTKYEKARMIGARALQISMGAPFMLKISKKEIEDMKYDPVLIATREYDEDVLPITIHRPIPDTRKKHKEEKEEKEEKDEKEQKE